MSAKPAKVEMAHSRLGKCTAHYSTSMVTKVPNFKACQCGGDIARIPCLELGPTAVKGSMLKTSLAARQ